MKTMLRAASVLALVMAVCACNSKVTPENFAKLDPGMTKSQVHSILGSPDQVDKENVGGLLALDKERWFDKKHSILVTFSNDELALKSLDDPDEATR